MTLLADGESLLARYDLSTFIAGSMLADGVPGLSIGIRHGGNSCRRGFGVASLDSEMPVRGDTVFRIGSITKVFTALLALQLVDEGEIDLDDPISAHLPNVELADPDAGRSITIRDLLRHTSGLFGDDFADHGTDDGAVDRYLASLKNIPQLISPGQLWAYCNTGYYIAGAICARLTKMPFEQAVNQRLLQPLGLRHTSFQWHDLLRFPIAVGHDPVDLMHSVEHRVCATVTTGLSMNPSGGLISTVDDLLDAVSTIFLNDGGGARPIVSRTAIREMVAHQVDAGSWADFWGLGLGIRVVNGVDVLEHRGWLDGFQAQLTIVPQDRFAVAVLSNSGRGRTTAERVVEKVLADVAGIATPSLPGVEVPLSHLSSLAGVYSHDTAFVAVEVGDEGLVLRRNLKNEEPVGSTGLAEALKAVGFNRFQVTSGPFAGDRVEFLPENGNRPPMLRIQGRLARPVGG